MGRGFFSGTFWGLVIGAIAIVGATQMVERSPLTAPQPEPQATGPTEVPDSSEFAEVTAEDDPVAPAPDTPAVREAQVSAPAQPTVEEDAAPALDVRPTEVPAVAADAPVVAAAPDIPEPPAAPSEIARAPAVPGDVADPVQPASDPPLVAGLEAPVAPAPEIETEVAELPAAPAVDAAPAATGAGDALSDAPAPPAGPEVAGAPSDPEAPVAPEVAEAPEPTPAPAREPASPASDGDAPAVAEAADAPDEPPASEEVAAADPQPVLPGVRPGLPGSGGGLPGQRAADLPGTTGVVSDPSDRDVSVVPAALETGDGSGAALMAYRVPYDGPSDLPLISLVLIVPDTSEVPPETLATLPFPTSFAVDASAPGAADVARTLRAAGAEILMIPNLPAGATPGDVEQALQANLATIPEAIAFMDDPDQSFQADRTALEQLVQAAGATGHGLVTFPRGFNTAQRIAERDGVPAALVFRDLDGAGQSADDIQRTLDQAAFRARQEGRVILAARATPATVTALTEWALGTRAATVALAPVSALIAPAG